MIQELDIDIKDVGIGTENYINITKFSKLGFSNAFKPSVVKGTTFEGKLDILGKITYHRL